MVKKSFQIRVKLTKGKGSTFNLKISKEGLRWFLDELAAIWSQLILQTHPIIYTVINSIGE